MMKQILHKSRARLSDDSGFTLLEMLVVIAISSIILILIYSAHSSIITAIHRLTGVADFYENINLALNRIDKDVACAYINKKNKKLAFIGENNYESPYNGKINFVSVDHNDFSMLASLKGAYPKSDIKEIGYYLELHEADDENPNPSLFYLMRREENHYDDEPETGGEANILLENVVDIKFEFRTKYGKSWSKQIDSKDTKRFPMAVKTTLIVKDYNSEDQTFVFISYVNISQTKMI